MNGKTTVLYSIYLRMHFVHEFLAYFEHYKINSISSEREIEELLDITQENMCLLRKLVSLHVNQATTSLNVNQ